MHYSQQISSVLKAVSPVKKVQNLRKSNLISGGFKITQRMKIVYNQSYVIDFIVQLIRYQYNEYLIFAFIKKPQIYINKILKFLMSNLRKQYFLLKFLLLVYASSIQLFSSYGNLNFKLPHPNPQVIKIASDQSRVIVGYLDGKLESYDMEGKFLNSYLGHNSTITDIQWIPGYGPIASNNRYGKAILFRPNGTIITTILTDLPIDQIIVTSNNSNYFVGLTLDLYRFEQYVLKNSSFVLIKSYGSQQGRLYVYSPGYSLYFAALNSQLFSYNCTTGALVKSVTLNGSIQEIKNYGNNYRLILKKYVDRYSEYYQFNSELNLSLLGRAQPSQRSMVVCPEILYTIVIEQQGGKINVYQNSFSLIQQLKYNSIAYSKRLDCSRNYLVSLNNSNYLFINYLSSGYNDSNILPTPYNDTNNLHNDDTIDHSNNNINILPNPNNNTNNLPNNQNNTNNLVKQNELTNNSQLSPWIIGMITGVVSSIIMIIIMKVIQCIIKKVKAQNYAQSQNPTQSTQLYKSNPNNASNLSHMSEIKQINITQQNFHSY